MESGVYFCLVLESGVYFRVMMESCAHFHVAMESGVHFLYCKTEQKVKYKFLGWVEVGERSSQPRLLALFFFPGSYSRFISR